GMQSAARQSRSIPPPTKERYNTNRFLGSRPVSPSDWTINRDDFVTVDHGTYSVGPMLHQLGARSDQGERANLVIDCLDAVLVEMGEAQLDHITIPHLVVVAVDLLVAESRKGASKAMGEMLRGGIVADRLSRLLSVLSESGWSCVHEKMYRRCHGIDGLGDCWTPLGSIFDEKIAEVAERVVTGSFQVSESAYIF